MIVIGAMITNFFILPEIYEAKTQILVNQNKQQEDYSSNYIQSDIQLIETYNEIIKSPVILDEVVAQLNLNQTSEELSEQISVTNNENSQIVSIKVTDQSPQQAVILANTIAEVFKNETPALMNIDNVSILSGAKFSNTMKPVKPNKLLNIGIAAVVSIFIGIGVTLIIEYFDATVKNEKDIEQIVGSVQILGYVSPFTTNIKKKSKEGRKKVAKKK